MDEERPKFDFRLGTSMDLDLNFEAKFFEEIIGILLSLPLQVFRQVKSL